MKYQEVIDYLYGQLPIYQRQGATAIKKDLDNILRLCLHLDNPQKSFRSIHIAGTNGKGTVSHLIAAMLQTLGLRVGLYTSPHYVDFRERIKINGDYISEDDVVDFVMSNRAYIDELGPSFFELTVAMAFDFFKNQKVDVAVIETGLGGRLDSTNIIDPELSVITHISLDHTDMLGDTVYQIAGEKAGIIKPDTPVVIGRHQGECDHVFWKKAKEQKASITFADQEWYYVHGQLRSHDLTINMPDHIADESPFMIENCITAIQAIRQYVTDHALPNPDYGQALTSYRVMTNYIGRWQLLRHMPTVITDSAHNPDAIKKVIARLKGLPHDRLHFVLGFVQGKDLQAILTLLPREASYYWVQPSIFRAMKAEEVANMAKEMGIEGSIHNSVEAGWLAADSNASVSDVIYIGGSSFVVSDALSTDL